MADCRPAGESRRVPAQDVTWTCHTCMRHFAFTILWHALQPVGIQCPDCQGEPVWVQPPTKDDIDAVDE